MSSKRHLLLQSSECAQYFLVQFLVEFGFVGNGAFLEFVHDVIDEVLCAIDHVLGRTDHFPLIATAKLRGFAFVVFNEKICKNDGFRTCSNAALSEKSSSFLK